MPSKPEIRRLQTQAAGYAKTFLAQKYRKEYQELYDAYLINRGITPQRAGKLVLKDERELLPTDNKE